MPALELHAMKTLVVSPATAESAAAEAHTSSEREKREFEHSLLHLSLYIKVRICINTCAHHDEVVEDLGL